MISVFTEFHPYRLKLARREPVEFTVVLKNKSREPKMITYEMVLAKDISLDKTGLKYGDIKQIEKILPGEEKKYKYKIYAKQYARTGEIPIKIKITENYKSFKYVEKEYMKELSLTIEE